MVAACVIIFLFTFTFYASNGLLVFYFNKVQDKANKVDRILTYLLPINGMYLYNTWVDVATQINLAIVLSYNNDVSPENSATIALSILLVLTVAYFILEVSVGERYLRYVFSAYPVFIWACIGILADHWDRDDEGSRNKIYVLAFLIISVVFMVIKIVVSILCAKFRPLKVKNHEMLKSDSEGTPKYL